MTVSARIDRTLCLGTGLCESMAPDLFLLDDDGIAATPRDVPAGDAEERTRLLRAVAECCPTGAITVVVREPGTPVRENAHESRE
ncbi:ferredoxin [Streptomyces sp. NPDC001478]